MIPELGWLRGVITGRFVLRASLYGAVAILLALLAAPAGEHLPWDTSRWVAHPSIRDFLEVIASSMLLVATFSLGTMVAAFSAAAQIASPRATKVLLDDPVSQNVISTLVGAFVFATIGLVGLSLGLYGANGRVLLLVATILVLVIVIITLFGWIDYLANLVRLGAVLNKVEAAAEASLCGPKGAPHLGARPAGPEPFGGHGIRCSGIGYVTSVDLAALDRIAARHGGRIRIQSMPGALVGRNTAVALASFHPSEEEANTLACAFAINAERDIEQDPRYGLIVLAEIAARALSPGVNDLGTAIGVISRLQRLLTLWVEQTNEPPEIRFPHVEAPPIRAEDLAEDAFGPLARDGAPIVEVGIRLQKALAALAGLGRPDLAAGALRQSERARALAQERLALESDRDAIDSLAAKVREEAGASPAGGEAPPSRPAPPLGSA
jgi:uncharacterized membrane protein